ncbi:PIN domain-containing protein [Enterococcus sp. BWT-B8]|uniref:PIN domain-containing protein n=1 Tax=Enterococcus sp. BWT-B8 TaxID=2885157 RepID=UPI001E5D53DB|nr:PIN domain-containing protein [Enterococcus sp. BWT-B8]MCB5950676.1 PIN domain-containing protein [Enterococcus sp. BWT-B8]
MNYLIDFENVSATFHELIGELTVQDKIYIFYTDKCQKISLDQLEAIAPADWYLIKVNSGQNALDFQLSSYLGYLIAKETKEKQKFTIVSNDCGYNFVVNFWKKMNITIKIKRESVSQKSSELTEFEKKFKQEFPSIYQKSFASVVKIVKGKNKKVSDIHNELVQTYGEPGKNIYKFVKPYLNEGSIDRLQ